VTSNIRHSLALVVLLAFLWGSGYALTKVAVETVPPITVSAMRGLIGGLVLLAVLGRRVPLLWTSGIGAQVYFVQALFNCILPWILVAWASRTIDAGLATILNSLSPIFIYAITWGITRHEPATGRKFIGVSLGLAGVLAIIGMDALSGAGGHTVAELACVAGALCYAIAGVMGRRFAQVSPIVPAAGATLMSAAVLIPLALIVEGWPAAPSTRSLLALAALGFFTTGLAFVVYFRLIATIGAIAMSSQAYLRIVIGVAIGIVFLGERPTLSMVVGLILVVAGTIAMTMSRPPRPA
jgi:drug/metabolite transporter (DMT)-like permease